MANIFDTADLTGFLITNSEKEYFDIHVSGRPVPPQAVDISLADLEIDFCQFKAYYQSNDRAQALFEAGGPLSVTPVTDAGNGTVCPVTDGGGGGSVGSGSLAGFAKDTVGGNISEDFTHNLGTRDLVVSAYIISTGEYVAVTFTATGLNTATVSFGSDPGTNMRVVIVPVDSQEGGGGSGSLAGFAKDTVGGNISEDFTHNLGTRDLIVSAYIISTGEYVAVTFTATGLNTATVNFGSDPGTNMRVVIVPVTDLVEEVVP